MTICEVLTGRLAAPRDCPSMSCLTFTEVSVLIRPKGKTSEFVVGMPCIVYTACTLFRLPGCIFLNSNGLSVGTAGTLLWSCGIWAAAASESIVIFAMLSLGGSPPLI